MLKLFGHHGIFVNVCRNEVGRSSNPMLYHNDVTLFQARRVHLCHVLCTCVNSKFSEPACLKIMGKIIVDNFQSLRTSLIALLVIFEQVGSETRR